MAAWTSCLDKSVETANTSVCATMLRKMYKVQGAGLAALTPAKIDFAGAPITNRRAGCHPAPHCRLGSWGRGWFGAEARGADDNDVDAAVVAAALLCLI